MYLMAVRDVKSEAFIGFHVAAAKGAAIRQFGDAAVNPDSFISKHPADYQLYALAEVNDAIIRDDSGQTRPIVVPYTLPELLASASDFVASKAVSNG